MAPSGRFTKEAYEFADGVGFQPQGVAGDRRLGGGRGREDRLERDLGAGRELDCEYYMSNNFAFGGINTSLVFRRV